MKSYNIESFRFIALNGNLDELKDISHLVDEDSCVIEYNSLTRLKANCTFTVTLSRDEALNLKAVRIYHILNDVEECLGTFLISTPTHVFEDEVQTIECTGYSTLWRISNNAPSRKYYVPKGTNCINEVKRILTMLGFSFSIADNTGTTSTNREWAIGTAYLDVINDLLDVVNYTSLYVDVYGAYKADKYVLPQDRQISKTYDEKDINNIIEPTQATEFDLFNVPNKFIFSCSSDPLLSLYAVYENTYGETGTNNTWVNTYVEEVEDVADYDTLYEKCKKKCEEATSIYHKVTFSTAIEMIPTYMPTISLRQYQTVGKYSITSYSIDCVVGGSMTLQGRRSVTI